MPPLAADAPLFEMAGEPCHVGVSANNVGVFHRPCSAMATCRRSGALRARSAGGSQEKRVLDRPLPVRGHALEAFSFPVGGLPALVKQQNARFLLKADLEVGAERYRYRVEPSVELRSGRLSVADEQLALLGKAGNPKGTPAIERVDSKLRVRRKGKPAHPREA